MFKQYLATTMSLLKASFITWKINQNNGIINLLYKDLIKVKL